ncbi:MAG: response regulator transcription factor [Acidimicrobiales bacterium]
MRLVLIEDDATIAVPLADGLRRSGYEVTVASTAAEGLEASVGADLVLLDLGLPDLDGSEVCRRIRETSGVPIIVISARSEEIDRVMLLESGADDYVVKPFGTRELVARIRAVSRRVAPAPDPADDQVRHIGGLTVDVAAHRAYLDGVELDFTPREFELLVYLTADVGIVHRRREILESVWDEHWYGPTKTLDVHVAALRRKLGDSGWIETVRGVGYRFAEPA